MKDEDDTDNNYRHISLYTMVRGREDIYDCQMNVILKEAEAIFLKMSSLLIALE